MKITWIEILIVVAIILIPASLVLRIIYGAQWLEWEYNLIESWGINRLAYDFIKAVGLISVAAYFVIKDRRKKKKEQSRYYKLPEIEIR